MSKARGGSSSRRTFLKVTAIAAGGVFALTRILRSAWAGSGSGAPGASAPTEAPDPAVEWGPQVSWTKFTMRARRIVFFAQEEAALRGENVVGTEHLLLGLVRENDTVAARILERTGLRSRQIRSDVERQMKPLSATPGTEMQLTPPAKRVINLAFEEARQLDDSYVGTEHLLLGLIREGESPAARVLLKLGADLDKTRREVDALGQELR
jgi:hypothetical protein